MKKSMRIKRISKNISGDENKNEKVNRFKTEQDTTPSKT